MQNHELKVIRTSEEHKAYLEEVQNLLSIDLQVGTSDSNRLDVLLILIEDYENKKYPIEALDPIDAIVFRMQEKGLKQADLVPYLGSNSRVSEILNRKRKLTIEMIKKLSVGLGLSAETLLGLGENDEKSESNDIDWLKFPINEMFKRSWLNLDGNVKKTDKNLKAQAVKHYIEQAGFFFGSTAFRRSISGEAETPNSKYAIQAWLARVVLSARDKKRKLKVFDPNSLNSQSIRELAQLSWSELGPLTAIEWLENKGIAVVIEPQLKGTLLDGAALKDKDGTPIIGLTLRYDRLDNFWFTLMHEVIHVWKHLSGEDAFVDNLDASSEDRREAEANRLASEAFIPRGMWRRTDAFKQPSKLNIEILAQELRIHPAIIAGRLRKDLSNYGIFNDLIGQGQVKKVLMNSTNYDCQEA
ncbi:ImmA/IrrE family metallo-endopeptidase [Acinetobacter bereziniae]|uniref:ImmA/IrrE family metallo-endopeptidase n=1 Tax=Acinetobacter bereziniae TaxID=106648 RepID=UPI0018FF2321|nr:ImmA/IrrE family metallo-endopeptidase [Acinetobacter bereziniae]MBJ8552659.1 ImmA/IrrE family metallo-endopeptidase [Acinetobacter bereziniae]